MLTGARLGGRSHRARKFFVYTHASVLRRVSSVFRQAKNFWKSTSRSFYSAPLHRLEHLNTRTLASLPQTAL